MASGFFALLDDISALVKTTAANLSDVPAQVIKTSGKVSGIVIDDTAVTPKYVVGLDPSRELTIIYRIAKRSLINKLLILTPAALLLGYLAPWAITPILMLGGAYLCFEGYEKLHSMFSKHPDLPLTMDEVKVITPDELEKERITGAVRTDIILSAEIIAIAYSYVTDQPMMKQILVMLAVGVFITIAVYGFVGLIVKADDIGLHLAKDKFHPVLQKFGLGLVRFMPHFLKILSYVGTAAMLWVGAEIIAHGFEFSANLIHDLEHTLANMSALAWFIKALSCVIAGIIVGLVVEKAVGLVKKVFVKKK